MSHWLADPGDDLSLTRHCLVGRRDEAIVGAIAGRWLAPQIGSLSGPLLADDCEEAGERLTTALLDWFDNKQSRIVTALRPSDDRFHDLLKRHGFASVARISFMVATRLSEPAPSSIIALSVPSETARQRWLDVLDGTFEQTQDCPALRLAMDASDALATFQRSTFEEQKWLIATRNGEDVGCLILGFDAEEEAVEILYLGVVHSCQRTGIGRELLQTAFAAARQRGSRRVGLGVDAANRPAVSLYLEGGFYEYDQRDLLCKQF